MTTEYDSLIETAISKRLPFIDWRLYKAQLWQESRFIPTAVSPAGATGIAQFMPDTWTQWAPRAGFPNAEPTDPEASIYTGASYMAHLYRNWSSPRPEIDRICLAMASYNAGLGHLLAAQRMVGGKLLYREIIKGLPSITGDYSKETITYVRRILARYVFYVTCTD